MKAIATVAMVGMLAVAVAGCTPRQQTGTAIGGLVGTGVGALATNSVGGAAVGGLAGAGLGYLITRNTYRCWRTNIFGHRYRGWCAK